MSYHNEIGPFEGKWLAASWTAPYLCFSADSEDELRAKLKRALVFCRRVKEQITQNIAEMSVDFAKMESVLAKLREQAKRNGGIATAQIFLFGSETDINEAARRIVSEAAGTPGAGLKSRSIGRVSTLAKSFFLTAEPAIFDALARNPRVKSILPSGIPNIYPKSRSRGRYDPS
jgi:hypothetical protein